MQMRLARAFSNGGQARRWTPVTYQVRNFSDFYVPSDMPKVKGKWQAIDIIKTTTETMKNVAAGKLPFVERQLSVVRPFTSIVSPFFELDGDLPDDKVEKIIHIGCATERGLCGIIGGSVPRAIAQSVKNQKKSGKDVENIYVLYGKKGMFKVSNILKMCHISFIGMKMRDPNFLFVSETLEKVLKEHPDFDTIKIYYNVYKSNSVFVPACDVIHKLDVCQEIAKLQMPLYEIEGDEATIFQNLLEHKIASQVYGGLAENAASEQGARLQSMDGAVRACKEKSEEYEKIYNRLRKTKITSELVILSAGVKCLEAQED